MTKEITDIIAAYKKARLNGSKTALATVVQVEGSSYWRAGARMLIEDNGRITGAISGGCLEGDALRKALWAIHQQQNKLVTYNTLEDDDIEFGVQLGCNGIVHILFEPINPENKNNPIIFLEKSQQHRKETVLVTLFSLRHFHGHQPGTCFFMDDESSYSTLDDPGLNTLVEHDALSAMKAGSSVTSHYKDYDFTAFVELLQPSIAVNIIGAGNDAIPLVKMAKILGWHVTVIDGRADYPTKERFPSADMLITGKPDDVLQKVLLDDWSVFILMTHNYNYDLSILENLAQKKCRYIGILGPKKRLERLLRDITEKGIILNEEHHSTIYGPIGLDIGAEAAEEIALSVLAEIKAVFSFRSGTFLRDRTATIHLRSEVFNTETT